MAFCNHKLYGDILIISSSAWLPGFYILSIEVAFREPGAWRGTVIPRMLARMARAYIAIGSNQGDRAANVRSALEHLGALADTQVTKVATLRETAPVDSPPESGPFLNTAAVLETPLPPLELLRKLFEIERLLGRKRWGINSQKNLPRTIDLDLVLYDDLIIEGEELTLPHPRMDTRAFVLEPLAEIAPDAKHPVRHLTVAELWKLLNNS